MPTAQHRFLDWLSESPIIRAADVVVVSTGLTMYGWLPYLKQLSDIVALIVPFATIFYMFTLAFCQIYRTMKNKD